MGFPFPKREPHQSKTNTSNHRMSEKSSKMSNEKTSQDLKTCEKTLTKTQVMEISRDIDQLRVQGQKAQEKRPGG